MKKIIVITLAFIIANSAFSQQTEPAQPMTKQDYLQKSKRQQKTAWLMLGGGTLVALGSMYWALDSWASESGSGDHGQQYFFIAGVCAMMGSIPMFIISGNNKKKAISMAIKLRPGNIQEPGGGVIKFKYYPGFSLNVSIN
ncbi:hypothetical protein [Terrimonas alba]|uniref:hypothetical protein n=1 Tax=Terrimonas alba TaxID=3349636 RepID=UPI0035F2F4A7